MIETISTALERHLSPWLVIFIISMLPILELRGGLVVASVLGLDWRVSALICITGNMCAASIALAATGATLRFCAMDCRWLPLKRLATFITRRGFTAGKKLQRRYPRKLWLSLLLFVGVPLPGTGAWSGAIASAMIGLKPRYAILPIYLGVLLSCAITLLLAYTLPGVFTL